MRTALVSSGFCAIIVAACGPVRAEVTVQRTDDALTLINPLCRLTLDLAKGCGCVKELRLVEGETSMVAGANLALYFHEAQHWEVEGEV